MASEDEDPATLSSTDYMKRTESEKLRAAALVALVQR